MASIFRRDDNYVEQPKRNTVDFSFQNNLTTDFGSLRPCFCTPVMPGDSFRIKPTFGLKFLPMVFPVQTRMKASIHYFYVRNRNLWKDWPDFIGKTKEGLVPPYIHLTEQNRKQVETCQLGDFLGIPTKIYGLTPYSGSYPMTEHGLYNGSFQSNYAYLESSVLDNIDSMTESELLQLVGKPVTNFVRTRSDDSLSSLPLVSYSYGYSVAGSVFLLNTDVSQLPLTVKCRVTQKYSGSQSWISGGSTVLVVVDKNGNVASIARVQEKEIEGATETYESIFELPFSLAIQPDEIYGVMFFNSFQSPTKDWNVTLDIAENVTDGIDVSELPLSQLPWRSDDNPNGIPLSALPFRAYEAIRNVFYRNAENNPLIINGVPEYNKWNRTLEGGADTNFYPIEYHNWEDDFLTTAVPSPQQGNAPLVGLSGTSTVTIGHDDGTTTQMSLEVAEDGSVTAAHAVSGDEATQSALVEAVTYGISINDFRNVNSFQRWLENNIRRGYKYKDQIKTHYGVSVRYDELDMPEFIGGTSQPVLVNQISQTVPTMTDDKFTPLGAMAGQASSVGQGSEITHYCDEHGFIIGILCVKPVANYSQLLPKYFNVTDTFDYYFPEFGHIGMQPITYSEVAPLQANLEGKLNDVFGYQRAWYDLIAKTDEVHGLFRSDFRNFLINRTFDGTPELGAEFTVMDPNQINDVFAYTENTDKILGQVYMEISKKTPIPLYGIPKLE